MGTIDDLGSDNSIDMIDVIGGKSTGTLGDLVEQAKALANKGDKSSPVLPVARNNLPLQSPRR